MYRIDKISEKADKDALKKIYESEDSNVLKFLEKAAKTGMAYLEVGAGVGRFADIVRSEYAMRVSCLEKNESLAEGLIAKNYETITKDICDTGVAAEQFDIIHCSHVIEHLPYPAVIDALDEMAKILRTDGYLIIRSPLWHKHFYDDIDHIRVYPPKSIIGYFTNLQQQRRAKAKFKTVGIHFRRWPVYYENVNFFAKAINIIFKYSWIYCGLPRTKINGYVLILKKVRS